MDFDFDLEQIIPVNSTTLTINSTGSLALSSGTTGERPGSPVNGMIRYNTTTNLFEAFENSSWTNVIGGGSTQNLFETITPDSGGNIVADTATDTLTLAGGTGITTVGTPGTDTITFDTVDSEIVHDNLSGFVANEHVDHSTITLTAGTGLTGGGDITASRTFNVIGGEGITANADDIELDYTVATVTAVAGDFIQISDASNAGAVRKVNASDFLGGGGTANDAVQARRSTGFTVTTAFQDVTHDQTDVETDAAVIEHDNTNTDDIDIKVTGTYEISYAYDVDGTGLANNDAWMIIGRVRLDDTSVINGSLTQQVLWEDTSVAGSDYNWHVYHSFIVDITAPAFVTLQVDGDDIASSGGTPALRADSTIFKVKRLI